MGLTTDLQIELNRINSGIELSKTVDGESPSNYAFLHDGQRQFRISFATDQNEYSVILYERPEQLNYEWCSARAVIFEIKKLAQLINLWANPKISPAELKSNFPNVELFQPISFQHKNVEIENSWLKIQNMIFNREEFWWNREWERKYFEMLIKAKEHKSFQNFFPLTSHYNLRFSIDKHLKEAWPFVYSIVPNEKTEIGNFRVNLSMELKDSKYFYDINLALDYYASVLEEIKPTKW